jgi:hypothetical protein
VGRVVVLKIGGSRQKAEHDDALGNAREGYVADIVGEKNDAAVSEEMNGQRHLPCCLPPSLGNRNSVDEARRPREVVSGRHWSGRDPKDFQTSTIVGKAFQRNRQSF